jgi:hypothetical protein
MRRPSAPLSTETLVEETRFVLRTLVRADLFGKRARLTEAERVLDGSLSLGFSDYTGFLAKYGYVRVDTLANVVEVTEGGEALARGAEEAELAARLGRHFARELGTQQIRRPSLHGEALPAARPRSLAVDAPPQGAPQAEEIIDRRYRRGRAIAEGPLGEVFEAEQLALMRPVVMKAIRHVFRFATYLRRDEIVRRVREATFQQARLDHPHVLPVVDLLEERELLHVVVAPAPHGDLRARIRAAGEAPLSAPFVARCLLQIASALEHAHADGVLHLGLKPENVLFDARGNVRVSDFGLARVAERDDEGSAAASQPVMLSSGSIAYFAPERLRPDGVRVLGPPVDVYALGILAYECLTGRLPGRRSPLPSEVRPELPPAFDALFDRMTRDEIGDRIPTMSAVVAELHAVFGPAITGGAGHVLTTAHEARPEGAAPTSVELTTGEVDVSEVEDVEPASRA